MVTLLKRMAKGQGGDAPQAPEEGQTEGGGSPAWGVSLSLRRKNLIAAGALLAGSLLFFLLAGHLVWEDPPTGRLPIYMGYAARYWLMALFGVTLCLVEFKMPHSLRVALGWGILLAAPLPTFFLVDLINGVNVRNFPQNKVMANYLCYFLLYIFFYALFRRVWAAVLAGGGVSLLFAIANYFVTEFRGQIILPWDFQSIGTAMAVSGGYEYLLTRRMTYSIVLFFCAVAASAKLGPQGKAGASRGFRIGERAAAFAITGVLAFLLFPADILTDLGIEIWPWNQKTSSTRTGLMAGFVGNVQFIMVEKPAGYSQGAAQSLGEEAGGLPEPVALGSPGQLPTVIAIMNESMTDMTRLGDLELNQDNMPYIHSLQESGEMIWGTAYSSVFGGDTCNSEYEFLTGNTTAFLPTGSKPYQQYVDHPQLALPTIMKSYGYRTIAIHPAKAKNWSRDTAYPNLDFDQFIDMDAFDVTRRREHNNTSDLSNYEQVIYSYEHRGEDPLFLFNITIQNHGGYGLEDYASTVQLADKPGKYPQAEQYLTLTKRSDEALEYLLEYFEKQEDPVVVLFFGDHWPSLEEEFIAELLGTEVGSTDIEDIIRKYQVPFFIWANYPLEAQEMGPVSLNYLSGLLLQAAGLEGTPYTKFLDSVRESLPVITAIGTIDKDGNVYENGDSTPYDSLLHDYSVLQYNHAFGGKGRVDSIFTR